MIRTRSSAEISRESSRSRADSSPPLRLRQCFGNHATRNILVIGGAGDVATPLNDPDRDDVVGRIDPEPGAADAPPPEAVLADLSLRRIGVENHCEVVAETLCR